MTPLLKPCPFCGSNDVKQVHIAGLPYPNRIQCQNCEATAGGSVYENRKYNAECWNKRAKEPAP